MSDNAFPKSMRLLKKQQFAKVKTLGKNRYGKFIIINAYRDPLHTHSLKLGITATRKFGKAHIRNLFKRRVREAFRLIDHNSYLPMHFDVRPTLLGKNAKFSDIRQDLEKLLIKNET